MNINELKGKKLNVLNTNVYSDNSIEATNKVWGNNSIHQLTPSMINTEKKINDFFRKNNQIQQTVLRDKNKNKMPDKIESKFNVRRFFK